MLLAAVMIGSGIAARQLPPGDIGLELRENAAATAGGLFAIMLMFGPVSGGHFNPVASIGQPPQGYLSREKPQTLQQPRAPTRNGNRMNSLIDSFRLDGKVAIVTGASSGLGVAFATGLAQAGADIAICARRVEKLEETRSEVEAFGRRCVAVRADVSDPDDCNRVVADTVAELGGVDILINNAGVGTAVPATREAPDEFRRVIEINLNGSYFMAQACGRAMRENGGSIVNIGSVLGSTTAFLPQAAYAASKAGIIGLTRDLAQQWTGRKGIRVNALAPGFFATEMTEQYPEGYLEQMMFRVPTGRVGEARELVAAALFLASDAASYITGVLLPVDGGLLTT